MALSAAVRRALEVALGPEGEAAAAAIEADATIDAGEVTQAMDAPNSRDGTIAANLANGNIAGAIDVIHRFDLAAGANADTDIVLTHKTRVIDAWTVLRGAGVASCVLTVKNGATAICGTMAASGSDLALVRTATIDDAQWDVAAGGTLRVTSSGGASQPTCTVFVRGVRVA